MILLPRKNLLQREEDSPIEDFYHYVECSDVKIDLQIEDFYGEHDSMKKNSGKKWKKHEEAPHPTQRSMESRSPRGFSGHRSSKDMTARNPHVDTTNPPIWLSGLLDSMKQIESKVDKSLAEVEKIINKAEKKRR
jgi:hypothetical protein